MSKGFFSESDIARVRDATDIVALISERTVVKQRGHDFWCCCPLHNEKTPSFKIDPALGLWHCFGCGEGGDVFGFLMKVDDLSFPEAVRKLAERAHIDIVETGNTHPISTSHKARLKEICTASADFYHTELMRNPNEAAASARAYLASRGFGGTVPGHWNLGFAPGHTALIHHLTGKGYAPEEMLEANVATRGRDGKLRDRFYNRIMFPICDVAGECIAFGGRVIGSGEPKYLNTQETPIFHKSEVLYGLHRAKAAMTSSGIAIVCEGYTDVISLHEAGVQNVVATLGTALTMRHIRVLSRHAPKRIVYLFDGDAAGQRAADRALEFIDYSMTPEQGARRVDLCAVTLPDNLDPAEFVAKYDADELRKYVNDAQPLLKYGIQRRLNAYDLTTAEGRSGAFTQALAVLAPIKNSLLAKEYAIWIAGRCRVRESDALNKLANLKSQTAEQQNEAYGNTYDNGTRTQNSAPRPFKDISETERNRLRFERELLCLAAQHPARILAHVDGIAQTRWHDAIHAQVAQSILATLTEDPHASPGRIITDAVRVYSGAAGLLTSKTFPPETDITNMVRYISEELALGDMEDEIASIRTRLRDGDSLGEEESNMLFQVAAGLQKDLTKRIRAHKVVGTSTEQ